MLIIPAVPIPAHFDPAAFMMILKSLGQRGDIAEEAGSFSGSASISISRLLKNGLGRNSAFFLFLLSEAEVHSVEGPT